MGSEATSRPEGRWRKAAWWQAVALAALCTAAFATAHHIGEVRRAQPAGAAGREENQLQRPMLAHARGSGRVASWEIAFSATREAPAAESRFLPAETKAIYGLFQLPTASAGQVVGAEWWWNGESVGPAQIEYPNTRSAGPQQACVTLQRPSTEGSLGHGLGEVEVFSDRKLIARGSFVSAVGARAILSQAPPEGPSARISALYTASTVDLSTGASERSARFDGDQRVWLVFQYAGAQVGTGLVVKWYVEGEELSAARTTVTCGDAEGLGTAWLEASGDRPLPPGRYRAEVTHSSEATPLAQCSFIVKAQDGAPTRSAP